MGIAVLVEGESGSGKSASLRNFQPGEVGIFNVASKPLPFRGGNKLKPFDNAKMPIIRESLKRAALKRYVIDDSQYLMAFSLFDRAGEIGYGKFTDIAKAFTGLVRMVNTDLPPDAIVYFLHHVEITDAGRIKAKTVGKMIDNQMTLEGLFSIVLYCQTNGTKHTFITQSDGFTTAKSPMDMFAPEIDNDLLMVDTTIREYYELDGKIIRENT